jgi:two-component sensor histidine kinase
MLWHPGTATKPPARETDTDGRSAALWVLPALILIVFVSLTLLLWRAECRVPTPLGERSSSYALWGGLAMSVVLTVVVLQTLLHRTRAEQQARKHLQAIESIHAISIAINAQIGSGKALDALAEAAGKLLAMDRAGVSLVDVEKDSVEVVAAAGDMPAEFPRHFKLDQLPAISYCVQSNELIFESDIRNVTRPYSLDAVKIFGVVSMILIPLRENDRPIGLLTLSSSRPKEFSDADRRVCALLAAQAAVILANARLLEQTRRDAAAKTDLLRELNHRVKNNLSGIVALLEMNQPPMSGEVRLWLDRATDRIRAMASAHQLFTGEMDRVTLPALVAHTLSSVSVGKHPGVTIKTELEGSCFTLGARQAVGLAMVLYELCYNALVHALPGGGTLTIAARDGNDSGTPQTCVIEVRDEAMGAGEQQDGPEVQGAGAESSATDSYSGQGLELVEGLVRRELRGTFLLRPRPQGGTVATVEFPFDGGE